MKLLKYIGNILGTPVSIDKLISQAEVITFEGRKAIKKVFTSEVGIIKWLPLALLLRPVYPFTLDPRERFKRELNFFNLGASGKWSSFSTPRVLSVDENALTLIREYVEGDLIDYKENAKMLAAALAEVHSKGYVLGDVKPTNFVVGNELYIIDAEQATQSSSNDHRAWDLLLTTFFMSYLLIRDLPTFKEVLKDFLKGYLDSGGGEEAVKQVASIKLTSLSLLIPLPHLVALGRVLEELGIT